MSVIDSDYEPFDGCYVRNLPPVRTTPHQGHGRGCSSNPAIGCICGNAEYDSQRSERDPDTIGHNRAMRRHPNCEDCANGKGTTKAGIGHSVANPSHGHCACRSCELGQTAKVKATA